MVGAPSAGSVAPFGDRAAGPGQTAAAFAVPILGDGVVDPETDRLLCDICTGVYAIAQRVTHRRDFWRSPVDQEDFRHQIVQWLITKDATAIDKVDSLADQLVEVIGHWRLEIPRP